MLLPSIHELVEYDGYLGFGIDLGKNIPALDTPGSCNINERVFLTGMPRKALQQGRKLSMSLVVWSPIAQLRRGRQMEKQKEAVQEETLV